MPAARALRVAVCGLGTAGAAAATLLARSGRCSVHVWERGAESGAAAGAGRMGAGIELQPVGLRVLEQMGLLEAVVAHGARLDSLLARTAEGRTVLDLRYACFDRRLFGVGLLREVLHRELAGAVMGENSVAVRYGESVAGACVAETASANAADPARSYLVLQDGRLEGPYDLIIGCDGRSSALRRSFASLGLRSFEHWYRYGCLWTVLPDKVGFLAGRANTLTQRLDGARKMLGFLPSGRAPGDASGAPTNVSLFWSLDMSTVDAVRAQGLEAWKAQVVALVPSARALVGQIERMDELIPAYYSNTFMPRLVYGSSMVLIGDAAHATSPQLGQGSNLALVDAWCLAQCLERAGYDVATALADFDAARRWRLRFYQLNSALLTPVFQSDSRAVGALRDLAMGPLCRVGPSRDLMLGVLVGAQKNGLPYSFIDEDEYVLRGTFEPTKQR